MRLVRTVLRLLHCWWSSDRIRVAPGDGRLLRLEPGCYLRILGTPAQVVRRQVMAREAGPVVVVCCATAAGLCELRVEPTRMGMALTRRQGDEEKQLAEADVDVIRRMPGTRWSRRCKS